jgi:TolB-like protein/predicted Zn-dependent protease
MAYPLPDKPSIAVLPFVNMSDDPKQEYFSDGLTEEIITAVSKVPKLFVIARNSTFSYKGKSVKVKQVAEELGVRYVLEGSVRKAGDRVRITAQLIDALTGHHLWAERYERDLKDIFVLQDEITMKIITAMQVKLAQGEEARLSAKGTDNLEAYLKYLQAREYVAHVNKEDNALGRKLAEEAISLDPDYAAAYVTLGGSHWMDIILGSTKSPKESLKRAFESTKRAIALDDSDASAHASLGWLFVLKRQHDKGIAESERAVALAPNSAHANFNMGRVLRFAGRPEEAIAWHKKAIRHDPMPSGYVLFGLCHAYWLAGRSEEGVPVCKKAILASPNNMAAHLYLAGTYVSLGRIEEARGEAQEVLRIDPKFSLAHWGKILPFKNQADTDRFVAALRKTGLPETPALPLPDKPSIAVLPFVNMSGDPEQEYFSDGLTEEIISALSRVPKLFVIARTSSFKYKDKEVDVRAVGRELGVQHVLEGSVRKAGDKVRITAQLVDAKTGKHLWAERYDRELKDIFAIQDEITMKIITALQVKLTEGEQARVWARGTDSLKAYEYYLRGFQYFRGFTKEESDLARQWMEKAIEADPDFSLAWASLGWIHQKEAQLRWSKSPAQSFKRAVECAQKAIALDDSNYVAYSLLSRIRCFQRDFDQAIASGEKAVALNPNSADAAGVFALTLVYSGRPEEAIGLMNKAMRLSPYYPAWYLWALGFAYFFTGQHEEAISGYKVMLDRDEFLFGAHAGLARAYSELGRNEEAREHLAEVLRINPKLSLSLVKKMNPFKNQADLERVVEAWRKIGLK